MGCSEQLISVAICETTCSDRRYGSVIVAASAVRGVTRVRNRGTIATSCLITDAPVGVRSDDGSFSGKTFARSAKSTRANVLCSAEGSRRTAAVRCSLDAHRIRSAFRSICGINCLAVKPSARAPDSRRRSATRKSMGDPRSAWVPALDTSSPVSAIRASSIRSTYGDRQTLPVHTTSTLPADGSNFADSTRKA